MKKLLALMTFLPLTACGEDRLQTVTIRLSAEGTEVTQRINANAKYPFALQYADTLNEAMMTVESGRADNFLTIEPTAKYLAARSDHLRVETLPVPCGLYMLALENNPHIQSLNDALVSLN